MICSSWKIALLCNFPGQLDHQVYFLQLFFNNHSLTVKVCFGKPSAILDGPAWTQLVFAKYKLQTNTVWGLYCTLQTKVSFFRFEFMGAQAINGKQQSLVTYSMNQEYKVNNIFILSLGSNRWEDFISRLHNEIQPLNWLI